VCRWLKLNSLFFECGRQGWGIWGTLYFRKEREAEIIRCQGKKDVDAKQTLCKETINKACDFSDSLLWCYALFFSFTLFAVLLGRSGQCWRMG